MTLNATDSNCRISVYSTFAFTKKFYPGIEIPVRFHQQLTAKHANVSSSLKKIHKRRCAKIKADLKKFGLRKTNSKYSYRNNALFLPMQKFAGSRSAKV